MATPGGGFPELWDVDNPVMPGTVQNQDSYMQSVAAQRPYFFDHICELAEQSFREFYELTGRRYQRVMTYRVDDADYLIFGQGSMIPTAEAVADYLRETRGIKVGVVNLVMFRPFPADLIGRVLKGKKGVAVLERLDQPLAVDLPLMREVRATMSRCMENGRDPSDQPFPDLETYRSVSDAPALYSGSFGMGSRDLQPEGIVAAIENMLPDGARRKFFYLSIDFLRSDPGQPQTADSPGEHRRQLSGHSPAGDSRIGEPQLDARRQHHRSHAFGRRLGCDHDGQESGDDAVRFARFSHQGESQVRFGKEGAADDLLLVGRAGTDSHQQRVLLCRRGALARPERLPAHQRVGGTEGRRRVHHSK